MGAGDDEQDEAARVLLNPPLLALYALTHGMTHAAARRMLVARVAGAPAASATATATTAEAPTLPNALSNTYRTPVLSAIAKLRQQTEPHVVLANVRPH